MGQLCSVMTAKPETEHRSVARDWTNSKCFHCQKQGHSFRNCPNANESEKSAITANLPALVNRMREQKYHDNNLNSNRRSTPNSRSIRSKYPESPVPINSIKRKIEILHKLLIQANSNNFIRDTAFCVTPESAPLLNLFQETRLVEIQVGMNNQILTSILDTSAYS